MLRDVFSKDLLTRLNDRSAQCFSAIATDKSLAERYHFNPFSHSVPLSALLDFGYANWEELVEPLLVAGLDRLFSRVIGCEWTWSMEQSWLRKKFAPCQVPNPQYRPQNWHQDGALGVRFPLEPGPVIPMTQLLTCWIPLNPCGSDSPGLEFIRSRQQALLHFTELDDLTLRQRFRAEDFWTPIPRTGRWSGVPEQHAASHPCAPGDATEQVEHRVSNFPSLTVRNAGSQNEEASEC